MRGYDIIFSTIDGNARREMKFSWITKLLSEFSFRDAKRELCSSLLVATNRKWRRAKLKPDIVAFNYEFKNVR